MARKQMDPEQKRTLKDTALKLVNRARAAFDMEPLDQLPKGTKGEPTSCPLAIALDHGWAVGGCDVEGVAPKARKTLLAVWADDLPDERVTDDEGYDVDWVELPGPLSEFVDRFDSDEFPELIERDE